MITQQEFYRGIDPLGRIVIPKDMRKMLDIQNGDLIELSMDQEHGQIIIRKMGKVCLKCRTSENLKEIKPGFYLCTKCLGEVKKRKTEG